MSNDKISDQVCTIIARVIEVDRTDITPQSSWQDKGVGSFAIVELIVAIQEHFGIRFESSELKDIVTVQALVEAVQKKIGTH